MRAKMKYEIDIEGLPEGWEPVAYRVPETGEWFLTPYSKEAHRAIVCVQEAFILKKIQPRRIVLEETAELSDPEWSGQTWVITEDGNIAEIRVRSDKVWREVK